MKSWVAASSWRGLGVFLLAISCGGGHAGSSTETPPADPSTQASTLTPPAQPIAADGVARAQVTLLLRDASSQALAGRAVRFTVERGVLASAAAVTDGAGAASAQVTSAQAGIATVTATSGSFSLSTQVTFTAAPAPDPAPAKTQGLTIEGDQLRADGTATARLTVLVLDGAGKPVAGAPVDLSALGSKSQLEASAGVTGIDGTFVTRLSSTRAESKIVVAHGGGSRFAKEVRFVPGPPAATTSGLTSSASRLAADGVTPARLVLRLADAADNPLPGLDVALALSGANAALSASQGKTGADGTFRAVLTSSSAGDVTVTASAGSLIFPVTVAFAADAPSAAHSSLSATANAGTATIALTLRDAEGRALGGVPVALRATGGGVELDPASGATAADGTFTVQVRSRLFEAKVLTASVAGLELTAKATFTGPAWQHLEHPVWGGLVHAVAFDPAQHGVAYAGAAGGLYRTADGGRSWRATALREPSWSDCLVVDPATSDVYACAGKAWVSHDQGSSWKALTGGSFAKGIAFSQGTLYVSYPDGLFKSKDAGRTMVRVASTPVSALKGVVADPLHPDTVFAWSETSGIFASTNGGTTWSNASGALPVAGLRGLAIDPAQPARLYAWVEPLGLYLTDDAGAHWSFSGLASKQGMVSALIVVDPGHPATVYVAAGENVWRSLDRAATWTRVSGLGADRPLTAYGIGIDPDDARHILVGGIGPIKLGVFDSADQGSTWSFASDGIDSGRLEALVADPFSRDVALASVDGLLIRTDDGGATWRVIHGLLPPNSVESLVADPAVPDTYYAMLWNDGIWKTTDGGASWNRTLSAGLDFEAQSVYAQNSAPPAIFASESFSNRVYRSVDSGASWALISAPAGVSAVTGAASDAKVLYAAGNSGVFYSADGGANWARVQDELANPYDSVRSLQIDPSDAKIAYVVTQFSGLLRTLDAGATWTVISSTVSADYGVAALAIDPVAPSTLYGAFMNRVYKSGDRGESWRLVDVGIDPSASVSAFSISPVDPRLVYLGTVVNGVYRTATAAE